VLVYKRNDLDSVLGALAIRKEIKDDETNS
jgi:hypothetical protein